MNSSYSPSNAKYIYTSTLKFSNSFISESSSASISNTSKDIDTKIFPKLKKKYYPFRHYDIAFRIYDANILLRYWFPKQFLRLSAIFGEMSYFIIIIAFFLSIVSRILGYNVQVYRSNIGSIYNVEHLLKASDIGLYRALLILSSGRSF